MTLRTCTLLGDRIRIDWHAFMEKTKPKIALFPYVIIDAVPVPNNSTQIDTIRLTTSIRAQYLALI